MKAWVLAVLAACGGGGKSIPFDQCDHISSDSECCVTSQSCDVEDRCVQPEPRTVTGFCAIDDECSEGEFCDLTTNQCNEVPCGTADECPPDFECPNGACLRRSCVDSNECSAFCVEGGCFQRAGECR